MAGAITSAGLLFGRELPSHVLRITQLALRLFSHLWINEIQAVSLTLRGVGITARAAVHSRKRLLYVCGGSDGRRPTEVSFRMDPVCEKWEVLPAMRQGRIQAAGTVAGGRLFLCGGTDGHNILESVECFNPGMQRWEAAPSMLQPRVGASAVAVDGYVCVCGGRDSSGYLNSTERFLPRTAEGVYDHRAGMEGFFHTSLGGKWKWRVTLYCRGMVIDARDYVHQQAILRSDSFIVTTSSVITVVTQGGKGCLDSVVGMPAKVEGMTTGKGFLGIGIQDVAQGRWVLSKRKTVNGASTWREGDPGSQGAGNEEVLTFDSKELAPLAGKEVTVDIIDTFSGAWGWICASSATISSVELTGHWEAMAPMQERRCYAAAGKLPGRLLLCGGLNQPSRSLNCVECFIPTGDSGSGSWSHVPPMLEGRAAATAAALGEHLYVCGGIDGPTELWSTERFDHQQGHWETLAPMKQRRKFASAAACAGAIYVFGGLDGKQYLKSGERFEVERWQWEALVEAMPDSRAFCIVAAMEGPS